MAERLKAHAWKACVRESVPWVRIPLPPGLPGIPHKLAETLGFLGVRNKRSTYALDPARPTALQWGLQDMPTTIPNLVKRRRLWVARLQVPKDVQAELGRRILSKSTGHTDLAKAHAVAAPILAGWKADIDAVRAGGRTPVALRVLEFTRAFQRTRDTPESEDIAEAAIAWMLARSGLSYADAEALQTPEDPDIGNAVARLSPRAAEVGAIVRGLATPWLTHVEQWRDQAPLQGRQLDQYVGDITRFPGGILQELDGGRVQAWIAGQLGAGLTGKTVRRKLAALRHYWLWMQAHQLTPTGSADPFAALRVPTGRGAVGPRRSAFTQAEICTLHAAAVNGGDQPLADLIALGAYTGARIAELCGIQADHVDLEGLTIRIVASKTPAGVRTIPLHTALVPLITRLLRAGGGYVVPVASARGPGNQYGDRSAALGKRFGRLKTCAGFGPDLVFHSIRKTVATLLEDAGAPEGVAADILGHEKPSITYGLYSGGASLATKRLWLETALRGYPSWL